jgi:hypothetical protein
MRIIYKVLFLAFFLILSGCATVNYLPTDETAKYKPTNSLKVYWSEPQEPYTTIGKLSVNSGDFTEEELFVKLKTKAKEVGANAIIMKGSSQQSSVVGVPTYGGGTIITPVISTRLEAIAIRFIE